MNRTSIAALVLACIMVAPAMAQDDAAKGKKKKGEKGARSNPAMQMIKQLEAVGLTDEQKSKIQELGKAQMASLKQLKEDAGITTELMKKRAEAQKAVKESGKKGKEMAAAIAEKAGLTEAQNEAFAKIGQSRAKLQREIVGLLTDEQKGKLPEKMQRLLKSGGKKGDAKKDGAKKKKKAE